MTARKIPTPAAAAPPSFGEADLRARIRSLTETVQELRKERDEREERVQDLQKEYSLLESRFRVFEEDASRQEKRFVSQVGEACTLRIQLKEAHRLLGKAIHQLVELGQEPRLVEQESGLTYERIMQGCSENKLSEKPSIR